MYDVHQSGVPSRALRPHHQPPPRSTKRTRDVGPPNATLPTISFNVQGHPDVAECVSRPFQLPCVPRSDIGRNVGGSSLLICRMGCAEGSFRQVVGMCESAGRQDEQSARLATVSVASDLFQKLRVEFRKVTILEVQQTTFVRFFFTRNHGPVTLGVRTMTLRTTFHTTACA